jgi:adenylate cyclase class 2
MNNQEIEVKFYVKDLKRLEARLLELGAALIQPRVLESNIRFDLPDGSLRAGSRVLRLRRAEDVRLTYKGKGQSIHGVLARDEIEFTVGDFETARQFLEALGYAQIAVYEKFRATYELEDTHIMLDELPYGEFVEIEGPGVDSIRLTATRLKLEWEAAADSGYLTLFKRFCAGASILRQAQDNASLSTSRQLDPAKLTFAALADFTPSPEMLGVRPADA